jgi:ligand-binding sensor protein
MNDAVLLGTAFAAAWVVLSFLVALTLCGGIRLADKEESKVEGEEKEEEKEKEEV